MKKNTDPERMCSACREKKPKSALWRIAVRADGSAWDKDGRAEGRGMYVCRSEECVRRLARRRNCQKQVGQQRLQEICTQILQETGGCEQ